MFTPMPTYNSFAWAVVPFPMQKTSFSKAGQLLSSIYIYTSIYLGNLYIQYVYIHVIKTSTSKPTAIFVYLYTYMYI